LHPRTWMQGAVRGCTVPDRDRASTYTDTSTYRFLRG
jgi:hypothetical protein